MLFLVDTEFFAPPDLDSEALAQLLERESAAALELQLEGVLVQLWRESGTVRAWGVWNVGGERELHTAMGKLPCSPHMRVGIRPVQSHPNSIRGIGVDARADERSR